MSDLYARGGNQFDELVIPESFEEALSYAEQLIWLYLNKQAKLVEGDNITLTENADGTVTISAEFTDGKLISNITSNVQSDKTVVTIHYTDGTVDTFNVLAGKDGVGISNIAYKETDSQGNYVYTVTLTDSTSYDITCPKGPAGQNGNGIVSIVFTNRDSRNVEVHERTYYVGGTSSDARSYVSVPYEDTYTITYSDGTTSTITVKCGMSVLATLIDIHNDATPNYREMTFAVTDGVTTAKTYNPIRITDGENGQQGSAGVGISNISAVRPNLNLSCTFDSTSTWEKDTTHIEDDFTIDILAKTSTCNRISHGVTFSDGYISYYSRMLNCVIDSSTYVQTSDKVKFTNPKQCKVKFYIYQNRIEASSTFTLKFNLYDNDDNLVETLLTRVPGEAADKYVLETSLLNPGTYYLKLDAVSSVPNTSGSFSYGFYGAVSSEFPADYTRVTIYLTNGQATTFDIPDGQQGSSGEQGPAGPGVPVGGTAGQVLSKVDGTDFNTEWVTPQGGGSGLPAGGTQYQILQKNSSTDGDASWVNKDILGVAFITMSNAINILEPTSPYSQIGSFDRFIIDYETLAYISGNNLQRGRVSHREIDAYGTLTYASDFTIPANSRLFNPLSIKSDDSGRYSVGSANIDIRNAITNSSCNIWFTLKSNAHTYDVKGVVKPLLYYNRTELDITVTVYENNIRVSTIVAGTYDIIIRV